MKSGWHMLMAIKLRTSRTLPGHSGKGNTKAGAGKRSVRSGMAPFAPPEISPAHGKHDSTSQFPSNTSRTCSNSTSKLATPATFQANRPSLLDEFPRQRLLCRRRKEAPSCLAENINGMTPQKNGRNKQSWRLAPENPTRHVHRQNVCCIRAVETIHRARNAYRSIEAVIRRGANAQGTA